jgi:Tfp pilus assembly pilus retraction ATPase PilT
VLRWDRLLETIVHNEASELWLAPGLCPLVRMGEQLRELQTRELKRAEVESLMRDVAPAEAQVEYAQRRFAEFVLWHGSAMFRATMIDVQGRCVGVVRAQRGEDAGTPAAH